VAYWAKEQGYEVYSLTFDYGQIALKEIEAATRIAEILGVDQRVLDLSSLRGIFDGVTSLVDEKIPMTGDFTDPIIVPFRNGIFLAIAVAYATSVKASHIFYGAQGSDESNYPDCRIEFVESYEKTARLGTDSELFIEAPFAGMQKHEIIRRGNELGVPFEVTWSCYLDKEAHCGICESCINRKEAFKKAGIRDPTKYLE
jgi:7-cyano-7-deazaguanine synthase